MIVRRDVEIGFEPDRVPRDWASDDPFVTTFLASLSLLFPEGERFFVDSVKAYKDAVTDPALRKAMIGFVGQEAMHGREHRAFNEMVRAHGHPETDAVERGLRRLLDTVRRTLPPSSQLAATCALEHFTAILAEGLLRHPALQDELHASIRPLWLWHALEESEHKAVAFDVYRASGGGEVERMAIMLLTTLIFFAVTLGVHARMLATRGLLLRPWRWARGITKLWIRPGHFTRMIPAYLAYFRPGFHPDDRDTTALLDEWRVRLFGDRAAVEGRVQLAVAS